MNARAHGHAVLTDAPMSKKERSPEEIALMRGLKQAFDPKGILNPGKVLAP